jgi:hypothetical protein
VPHRPGCENLLGVFDTRPFWYYFPVVFAIKLTVPVLAVLALIIVRPKWAFGNWALACAAVLLAFSLTCRVQIGIRLQLVCVAWLTIGLSAAIVTAIRESQRTTSRGLFLATVGGLSWLAIDTTRIWPNGLSFVNGLWGDRANGYQIVSDSNYDWGQGLPELAAWIQARGGLPLDVWYYGRDPAIKKLPVRDLPLHCVTLDRPEDVSRFCWGRYLAVGTSLQYGCVVSPAHRQALEFLKTRQPFARTTTFLIYDLTDVGPPAAVAAAGTRP